MTSAVLICHPQTPSRAVRRIGVRVRRTPGRCLAIAYVATGEPARMRLPPRKTPRRSNGLWKHTCFEVFAAAKNSPAYYEFNFSPSGEWAVYGFRGYRKRATPEKHISRPGALWRAGKNRVELHVAIDLETLKGLPASAGLRLGVSAVIEEADGSRSYWALYHPPGKPDFHHPDAFVIEIPPPDVATADNSVYN